VKPRRKFFDYSEQDSNFENEEGPAEGAATGAAFHETMAQEKLIASLLTLTDYCQLGRGVERSQLLLAGLLDKVF
jgi:hypothetical protein